MRLFFRAPAFFVLRAQKVGLRRRETEACGGRTFAYAHRRAAVCAGGAGKRCAPERDFSAAEAGRRLCLRTEIYCKNGKSAAKTRWYFSGILFLPLMRGPLCTDAPALASTRRGEPHCRRADLSALCAGKYER